MQGEQEGENTSKSSSFYQEATDQKDKRTPEFVLKPSMCRDAQTHVGGDVRLGGVCRGGCQAAHDGPWRPGGMEENSQPPLTGPGR